MPDGRAYESHILNLPLYLTEKLDDTNVDGELHIGSGGRGICQLNPCAGACRMEV